MELIKIKSLIILQWHTWQFWQAHVVASNYITLPAKILIEHWLSFPRSIRPRSYYEIGFAFGGFGLVTVPAGSFCIFAFWRMDNFWSKSREVVINHIFMKYSLHLYVLYKASVRQIKIKNDLKKHLVASWQGTL